MAKVQHERGKLAERMAHAHLQQAGLKVLRCNYHGRYGEIDIIAQDGQELVVLEVRYRQNSQFGNAIDSITAQKQRKIVATTEQFLLSDECPTYNSIRFDVIAIDGDLKQPNIQWLKAAFDAH